MVEAEEVTVKIGGGIIVIAKVEGELEPQALPAVTETLPDEDPKFTTIVFVP